ncbi:MAG: glycosyltransferase [Alphaproteobacteria bacterium]|jgi:glycosyltransferase involved in cell wall biosynthesis|nr:glycosyltransferase [Alphaproteobacteria bacterium]
MYLINDEVALNKISVIIPVYNVASYLEKCLDSVINQTLTDIEIICINDGSTDNSLEILKKYAAIDKRIILINQENQGLSGARNSGLKVATAPYIMFVDSDDWLELDAAKAMYKAITTNDCDLVQGKINLHYASLQDVKKGEIKYFKSIPIGNYTINPKDFITINHTAWGKLWKKEIIDKYEINFPVGLYYEDAPFMWKYLTASKSIFGIDNTVYNYLRRPSSIMSKTANKNSIMSLDHINVCINFYNYLIHWNLFNKYEIAFWGTFDRFFWQAIKELNTTKKYLALDLAHSFIVDKNIEHLSNKIDSKIYENLLSLKNKTYKNGYKKIKFLGITIYKEKLNTTRILFLKIKRK